MSDLDDELRPTDGVEARRSRRGTGESSAEPGPPDGRDGARPVAGRHLFRGMLIAVILALVGVAALIAWGLSPVAETSDVVEFEVLPGWGASAVSAELEQQGLIRNARLFSLYLRLRDMDRSIGEGLYDLDRAAAAPEIAEELVRGGRPRVARVVLPEGARAAELPLRLAAVGVADDETISELIDRPGDLGPAYLPDGATLEGYLFPASYELSLSDTPEQVLGKFLARFQEELDTEVLEELAQLEMSVHEWVILASVVQAEAGNDEEMPLIAGVFLNRLDLGMPLQSDPTVAYGLGKRLPELDPLAGDMRQDHPWNTYTRTGLPRGPINNPGRSALLSILAPIREDDQGRRYLYFLHGTEDGEIVFRLNTGLEGHNRDVDRYLRGR